MKDKNLWNKLEAFEIDDPTSDFTFTMRLARENGWSLDYAKRVVNEYKKFVYLSIVEGTPLTPSDEVDQAWHLHMLYTQSYWNDMCKGILGTTFHHGPTKGGTTEKAKYNNLYEKTKELYFINFGMEAPTDIWPSTEVRFSNIVYQRVNMHENVVINKKKVKSYLSSFGIPIVLLILSIFLMSTETVEEEPSAGIVIAWIIGIIAAIFIIRGIVRYINRNNRGGGSSSSSSGCDSGCTILGSFFGCGGDSGCSSSGCSSCSGCGGCGGCGGCS